MRRRHYSSGLSPEIETFTICVLLFIAGFFTFGITWVALLMVVVVRSTTLSSALLKPEPKSKRQEQEWPQLSRIRRAEEARRKQQEADEALKYAGTPDKPYVQKLTAEEQALKEKAEAAILRAKSAPSDEEPIEKHGPRGGRYTEDRTKDGRPYRRYF